MVIILIINMHFYDFELQFKCELFFNHCACMSEVGGIGIRWAISVFSSVKFTYSGIVRQQLSSKDRFNFIHWETPDNPFINRNPKVVARKVIYQKVNCSYSSIFKQHSSWKNRLNFIRGGLPLFKWEPES